jgi:UDP-N-acetylmuramoylalanine--D-glutamate ligase
VTAVESVGTLAEAVARAAAQATSGDVVLLSPGCASFDQFRDYADRGRQFKALVEAL